MIKCRSTKIRILIEILNKSLESHINFIKTILSDIKNENNIATSL